MKFTNRNSVLMVTIAVFLLLGATFSYGAASDKPTPDTVAFLPFTVHAAKDLAYLKEGVRDMLASRLAADAGILVVDNAKINAALKGRENAGSLKELRQLGKRVRADYLVVGSLTALGSSVSLNARVVTVSGNAAPRTFYAAAEQVDQVITAIDRMALDMAAKIFDSKRPEGDTTKPLPTVTQPTKSPYQTGHAERASKKKTVAGGQPAAAPGLFNFTKSQDFKMNLQAMDAGDVDGDGHTEVVLAGKSEILVYKHQGNRFTKVGSIPLKSRYQPHSVTLADLNRNGRQEIYVSAADIDDPRSFAVEWNGKGFDYVFRKARWFIRAINLPGSGMVLAGQRAGSDTPFLPGIHRLEMQRKKSGKKTGRLKLVAVDQLPVPPSVNLFDFSFADLDGDGQAEIVAIDQYDRLLALRASGKVLWKSDDYFGGASRYLGGEKLMGATGTKAAETDEDEQKRYYVPSRLVVADLNGDGRDEVVVNKNPQSASRVFERMKSYTSGEMVTLSWTGLGLAEIWQSGKIDGQPVDYQLMRGSGKDTTALLYVGLVLPTGWLGGTMSSKESTVVVHPFDLARTVSAP